jgi:hypothetical protein
MNHPGLLPATTRHLHRCILFTLILAILLIAATLWVYQRRIQSLPQKLNGSAAPAVSSAYDTTPQRSLPHIYFTPFPFL